MEVENLKDTFLRVPFPILPLNAGSASYLPLAPFVDEPPLEAATPADLTASSSFQACLLATETPSASYAVRVGGDT